MLKKKTFQKVKSEKFMRRFFARIIREFFPSGTRLKKVKIIDLSRQAFKKTLKYRLALLTPSGKTDTRIIRGNVPSRDTHEEIKIAHLSQKILYRRGFAFTPFQVPLSLGYYPPINLVLYEDYPGLPFTQYMEKRPKDLIYLTKQAALWLARLHELKIKEGKTRTPSLIKNEVGYFKDDYKNNYPGIYAVGATILENLWPLFEKHVFNHRDQFCLIHGDFNPNNIIINKNSIGVIDWGRSCFFDPISDLGNLIAQMNLIHWRRKLNYITATRVKKTFIDTYLEARHLKFKEIKTRFLLHELWWIMQIMAYSVSILTGPKAQVTVLMGLKKAKEICRELNISYGQNLSVKSKVNALKEIFSHHEVMMKFYHKNLRTFFPQAKKIISLDIQHPQALSETSYLTRTTLNMVGYQNEKIVYSIRGNIVSPQTYKILRHVYKHNGRTLISPRPLFYFSDIPYILYEETAGRPLRQYNFKNPDFPSLIKKAGIALAKLHALPPLSLPQTKIDELSLFNDWKNKVKKSDFHHYSQFRQYLYQYKQLVQEKLKKYRQVLSHNDFQASNILVTPQKGIAIIDYTLSSFFLPAGDLGNFLTHLEIMLDRILNAKKIKFLQQLFYRAYLNKINRSRRQEIKNALPLMRVRSALDIWAITVTLMGPKDRNRRRYISKLIKIIEENLNYK